MPPSAPTQASGPSSGPATLLVDVLAHGVKSDQRPTARLEEAIGLAQALNLDVRFATEIRLRKNNAATLIGNGHIATIKQQIEDNISDSTLFESVIFNTTLSPVQQRNLEREFKIPVIDRTGLILEIFGKRARSAEGRLQVELARLTYEKSRLVRSWSHLERQRASGTTGGPGETQIELDRRMIAARILKLKAELIAVRRTRSLHRESRRQRPFPIVALVGYTNSGKSTLFKALTQSVQGGEDMLFATLDTSHREMRLPQGRSALMSDTVGFISDLPHELVEAFRATLDEVLDADLILHVHDAANLDCEAQGRDVEQVLGHLMDNIDQAPVLDVWNKLDLMPLEALEDRLAMTRNDRQNHRAACVSAITGEGLDALKAAISERLDVQATEIDIDIFPAEGHILGFLYRHARIVSQTEDTDGVLHLKVRLSDKVLGQLARMRGPNAKPLLHQVEET